MNRLMAAALCVGACLGWARSAEAQVSFEVGAGVRIFTSEYDGALGASANADLSLPGGLFLGADMAFQSGDNDGWQTYMAQGGYRYPGSSDRGWQPYGVVAYGVLRNRIDVYSMFAIGAGVRYWSTPRFAPFIEYRRHFADMGDPDNVPWGTDLERLGALTVGFTIRP